MSVLIPVIFFIILLLVIPIRVNLVLNAKLKPDKIEFEEIEGMKNKIKIMILFVLQVFSKDIFEKQQEKGKKQKKTNKSSLLKALYKSLTFPKFLVSIGFNTFNIILNSYINALLNSTLCIYINQNNKKFNFKELYYQIHLTDIPVVLNLDISMDIIPIKFIFNYLAIKIEKLRLFKKEQKMYVKNV